MKRIKTYLIIYFQIDKKRKEAEKCLKYYKNMWM